MRDYEETAFVLSKGSEMTTRWSSMILGRTMMTTDKTTGVPKEFILRDKLATRLDLIDENLTLVEVEYFLSNADGASGFVDILARDSRGDLVIIELKRADQSARQALHELEKYVGLLAVNAGLRIDQLRCVLVSTTWHELAVPFTRYKKHVDFYVTGMHLFLDEEGDLDRCEEFVGTPGSTENEICPMYLGMLYENSDTRDEAALQVVQVLRSLSINDYIVVNVDYQGKSEKVLYPHGIFVVFAVFSPAVEEQVCTLFPEETEDVYEEDDYWHEQIIQTRLTEAIGIDEVVNDSPGHLDSLTEWAKSRPKGFGIYGDPVIWPEISLLELISGANTQHTVNYSNLVSAAHAPAWARMRTDVDSVINGDGAWPAVVNSWLDESEQLAADVMAQIYSPSDVLSGLELLARNGDRSYVAELTLGRKYGASNNLVRGSIVWDGKIRDCSLQDTLSSVGCDLLDYLTGSSWIVEPTIMMSLGLRYVVAETSTGANDLPGDRILELSMSSGTLVRQEISIQRDLEEFLAAHPVFEKSLLTAYERTILR
jgi:hypothetical protein